MSEQWEAFAKSATRDSFAMLVAGDPTEEDVATWLAAHDAEVRADEASQWAQAVIVSGEQGERIGAARAGVVAEEPEWETEEIQYGHLLKGGIFIVEHRGKNYSTHQRRIKLGRPESSWVVDESAAPGARRDGCFAHCDPEGWFSLCRVPVKQEGADE